MTQSLNYICCPRTEWCLVYSTLTCFRDRRVPRGVHWKGKRTSRCNNQTRRFGVWVWGEDEVNRVAGRWCHTPRDEAVVWCWWRVTWSGWWCWFDFSWHSVLLWPVWATFCRAKFCLSTVCTWQWCSSAVALSAASVVREITKTRLPETTSSHVWQLISMGNYVTVKPSMSV